MSEKQTWIQRLTGIRDRNAILICIGIALIFWLTNALSESYTHDYTFNLDYKLQDNVSFVSPPRKKMEARIVGQGWELLKASFKRKFRVVPLQVVRPEITRSDLIAAIYEHLSDYDVVVREVNIDVMNLDINMVVTRSVPINLDFNASCADGYVFLDSLHCVPAEVTVTGPASLIERMSPIRVQQVELSPLKADLDQTVPLVIAEQQYVRIEPRSVKLEASVEKEVKVTTSIPIEVIGDTTSVGLTRKTANLTYTLGKSKQNNPELSNIRIIAKIGPEVVQRGRVALQLLDTPGYMTTVRMTPDSVSLYTVE